MITFHLFASYFHVGKVFKQLHESLHFPLLSQWHQPLNSHHPFAISRDFNAEEPQNPASLSTIIQPLSGVCLCQPAAGAGWVTMPGWVTAPGLLGTRTGGARDMQGWQWPPARPGTEWWLLPSQLGSHPSSWYKSCQAASTPRILKAFGAIIYAMCFSVFTA